MNILKFFIYTYCKIPLHVYQIIVLLAYIWLTYVFYCALANIYLAMNSCDWSGLYLTFVILWFCFSDKGKERSCAENLCEQNCTQLSEGGFICSCRPGFKASISDRNSCDGRIYFLQFLLGEPYPFYVLHSFSIIKPVFNSLNGTKLIVLAH